MQKKKLKNTICLFGDSITYGAMDPQKGGWGERLRNFLDNGNYDARVYNCGICGDNSNGLLYRFNIECEAREPDIIFISIGINDSQFIVSQNSQAVDIERYFNNLQKIITLAKQRTDKVFILGLTDIDETRTIPVVYNEDKHYYKKNLEAYNATAGELSEINCCPFIDLSGLIPAGELVDGVHPGSSGHEKIFNRVKDFLIVNKILDS
jgi:lysophospholipase L1-like esterase